MTTGRKPTTSGKGGVKKLKLKKETIKDLDSKGKGKEIKGGAIAIPSIVACHRTGIYC